MKGLLERILRMIGGVFIGFLEETGKLSRLVMQTFQQLFRPPFSFRDTVYHMQEVGVKSFIVVLVTSLFTGGILALQSYSVFKRFHAESLMGTLVSLAFTRELGPVITALIIAGRVGSAMAAELGTMRVTEQIDALTTMAVNPVKYLILPRFIATSIMLPVLTMMADGLGVFGGYFVAVKLMGMNPNVYINSTFIYLDFEDFGSGLFKAAFFGMIIAIVGCYKGFYTKGGAEGVGRATTGSVVLSMMLVLISDYFLTDLLF